MSGSVFWLVSSEDIAKKSCFFINYNCYGINFFRHWNMDMYPSKKFKERVRISVGAAQKDWECQHPMRTAASYSIYKSFFR